MSLPSREEWEKIRTALPPGSRPVPGDEPSADEDLAQALKLVERAQRLARKRVFTKNQRHIIEACVRYCLERAQGRWSKKDCKDAKLILAKLDLFAAVEEIDDE